MRHAIGLGFVLLLVATGEGQAAGNQPFCLEGLWIGTGNMSTPRIFHAATLLPSGKVLVSGEFLGGVTAELYDPVTGTWSPTGSMSVPRSEHTLTLLPTGKVLVVGGAGLQGLLASAELYDPATGQWQATGSLSVPRQQHTATLLASGHVLVLGGLSVEAPTSSAELYDPAAGTWTPAAPMLARRYEHTATLLGSGVVLVAGGFGSSSTPTEAELYDPASRAWRQTGSLLAPHSQHTATRIPSGRVLVVGGYSQRNTELFDPDSETWADAGCTTEARAFHTATLLSSGEVLVAGGVNSSGDMLSSAELYGIFVSPPQVSLAPGASQTFTARGGSGFGYVWSFMQNKSGGTLTPSGAYQAGPVGGVTDVVQVVDSFANSATATVNVTKQASALSPTSAQANSMGCGTTGGATLPLLAGAVLVLLGWRSLRIRRPRRTPGSGP